jgi:tyrosyl-tRNA synthetase
MASMHVQLKRLWQNMEIFAAAKYGYKNSWARVRALVNNNSWLNKLSLLDFLRVLGAGTRVGPMLTRDTVRNKLDSGDGLSFAELSYPLLQGWDWWELLKQRGVQLQIGGADQYGNIITGMDAVSHMTKNHTEDLPAVIKEMKPFGFTVPLLTTSKGEKFGKSAGNAIWLDEAMTSSFDLYQFFLRSADADVGRYLKLFTLLPLPEIENLVQEHQLDPSLRLAQRTLAREVVGMIHGQQACRKVEYESGLLLRAPKEPNTNQRPSRYPTTDVNPEMNKYAPQTNSANAPSHNVLLPRSLVENQPFSRVLYHAGMVSSKGEGHRLIANGGAHVGSKPADKGAMPDALKYTRVLNWTADQTWRFVMDESLLILRVGKWKVKIIKVISDDEFAKKGLDAPGWQESRQSTPEEKIVGVFDKMTRKTTGKS